MAHLIGTYTMIHNEIEITLPNNQKVIIDKGLVVVGANGCGKTRLGVWLEDNAAESTEATE